MTKPEGGIPSMASALAGEISKGSIWYVVLGVVLALTGIVLIANPLLGGMALTMLVAILFIVNGGMYLVNAFMARSGGGFLFRVLLGVLTIGVGVWIYMNPDKGLATLTVRYHYDHDRHEGSVCQQYPDLGPSGVLNVRVPTLDPFKRGGPASQTSGPSPVGSAIT